MLYFLASMLVMLALLDRALRVGRLESLLLDTRFKLFALRDELRRGAINGSVPQNIWFEYLDTSITKAIDRLPRITAWESAALLLSYAHNKSVLQAVTSLFEALREEENQELDNIYKQFSMCILEFLIERHRTTSYVMVAGAHVIGKAFGFRQKLAQIVTVAPETSTLLEHFH